MTMTAETWKYVGSAVPASNIPSNVLDALYALGTSTTYADGSGRTQGSGVAGTWSRKQVGGLTEAVYANPVSNSHTVRHIWGASASARTPTMCASPADTWATNTILYGFSRDGSTLNATGNGWDQTLPFDTGSQFSGYLRTCALGTHTIARVHLFECADGVIVLWATSAGRTCTYAGLLLDPGVTYATSPNSAENTSGGRYFVSTNGGTTVTTTTSWTTASAAPCELCNSTSANAAHTLAVSIGGVAFTAAARHFDALTTSTSSTCITADGDALFPPIYIAASGGGTMFGRLREVCLGPDAKIGQKASSVGTAKAYAASTHPSSDTDTAWALA